MKQIFLFIAILISAVSLAQQWQIMPGLPGASIRYEDLWFINTNTGWVVEAGKDAIHKTTDGGLTFTQQFEDSDGG